MLFDWSITTIVVAFWGRKESACGFSAAARQTAAAVSATRATPSTTRRIVVRRTGRASAGASGSGIAPRRRFGSLAASSDAVTVGPPLEIAPHLGGQGGRPIVLRALSVPRELLRLAGEPAAPARVELLREQLERLPPLVRPFARLLDRDQGAVQARELAPPPP